jgi:AcrR family transcriptional regulator
MPRSAEQTRKRILEGAYKLFRRHSYSRVTMDDIAAGAKLTKRTLYHHFNSKDELLAKVLEAQHHLALQAFKTFGDRLSGSPEAIAEWIFRELAVWADRPRWAGSGFMRFVIELADLPGHPEPNAKPGQEKNRRFAALPITITVLMPSAATRRLRRF